MTQHWNWGGGTGMAPSLQAQSPPPHPPHPNLSSFYHVTPTYPSFATPLCIIYCQEKGTETRKEGSRKGGAVHPLTHNQNPGGMGVRQGFGPKPQSPRNPHSRSGTPQIKDRLLLQFPSSSWGQGPYLYCVCKYIYMCSVCDIQIHTHRYFIYNALGDHPNLESLCPKTSAWNWNEGSGGEGD